MIVEVFKTTITEEKTVALITKRLTTLYPSAKINFDLEDTDNVLRIENSNTISHEEVILIIKKLGYSCEALI